MLSPSDILIRPTSLNERLAVEAPAEPPPLPEPTPTTMAERFAPEAQKAQVDAPVRPRLEPPVMPGFIPQRRRSARRPRDSWLRRCWCRWCRPR